MVPPMLSAAKHAEPTVITLIEKQADLRGSQVALIGSDRGLSFDEMNRSANRLAFILQETLGRAAGVVAVCLPPSVDRIIAVLGILKSGRGSVVIDPRLHDQSLHDLVGHAEAQCVVTNPLLAARFGAELRTLDITACHLFGRDENPGICAGPDAAAYLRYTSGSTGTPKGVLHSHHAALGQGFAFVESVNLQAGDRLCCFTFFPHASVFGTLMTGAALHIVDTTSEGLRAIAGRLRQDRVTVLSSFPSMLRSLSVVLLPGGRLADVRRISFSGEPDEITVRAPFMSSGYWKRPELTREIFGSDTPHDGKTYYRTGDVGRVDSTGIITVLGRVDNQIKLRAYRITPEEIKNVLLRHPTIGAAAVRALPDERGKNSLAAYLVPAPDAVLEPAVLRAFAQIHLPKYMVPSAFFAIEALPQAVGGKLGRSALPDPLPLWCASQRCQ